MSDQDYIRKAVELAEGWHLNELREGYSQLMQPPKHPYLFDIEDICQPYLDALAAQLVRQVDAACGYAVVVKAASTTILGANDPPIFKHATYANDRTMNTIKAIVDSGVLK